jgi:serine/threonine protein kinase
VPGIVYCYCSRRSRILSSEALQVSLQLCAYLGDVFERLADMTTYNEKQACDLARQLIQAMAVLHERKIAHRGTFSLAIPKHLSQVMVACISTPSDGSVTRNRTLDLKPENLLLRSRTDESNILLADFGFACHVPEEGLRTRCGTVSDTVFKQDGFK